MTETELPDLNAAGHDLNAAGHEAGIEAARTAVHASGVHFLRECDAEAMIAAYLEASGAVLWPLDAKFRRGDRVYKPKGSSWQGKVVGFYCASRTPIGYAVESEREPGNVQVYPEPALERAPLPTEKEGE